MSLKQTNALATSDGALFLIHEEAAEHELLLQQEKFIEELLAAAYPPETHKRTVTVARNVLSHVVSVACEAGFRLPVLEAEVEQRDEAETTTPKTPKPKPRRSQESRKAAKALVDSLARHKGVGIDG